MLWWVKHWMPTGMDTYPLEHLGRPFTRVYKRKPGTLQMKKYLVRFRRERSPHRAARRCALWGSWGEGAFMIRHTTFTNIDLVSLQRRDGKIYPVFAGPHGVSQGRY